MQKQAFFFYESAFLIMSVQRTKSGRPLVAPTMKRANRAHKSGIFSHNFYIISVHRSHLDFVGATSGRPPKNDRILRIIDLFAYIIMRYLRLCKNAGMRHMRSPASVAAVPDGGSDGNRRQISSARPILYHCRRFPHARGKPRAPRHGARSLYNPQNK